MTLSATPLPAVVLRPLVFTQPPTSTSLPGSIATREPSTIVTSVSVVFVNVSERLPELFGRAFAVSMERGAWLGTQPTVDQLAGTPLPTSNPGFASMCPAEMSAKNTSSNHAVPAPQNRAEVRTRVAPAGAISVMLATFQSTEDEVFSPHARWSFTPLMGTIVPASL